MILVSCSGVLKCKFEGSTTTQIMWLYYTIMKNIACHPARKPHHELVQGN